jgi:hypothetical protein
MSASGGQCALNQTKRPPGLAMPKTLASRQSGHLGDAQRPVIRVSLAGHPSCRATLPHVLAIIGYQIILAAIVSSTLTRSTGIDFFPLFIVC